MNIDLFSYSNPGSRELNEDNYGIINDENRCSIVLCDGLGGYDCGEIASQYVVDSVLESFSEVDAINFEEIYKALKKANIGILEQQAKEPSLKGMRTTIVGCVMENKQLTYFNCGDSRLYYFSNGSLHSMTKDHSVSQMSVEMGDMSFDDIRFDADRNKLLKVLGGAATNDVGTIYKSIAYRPGDAFLLCSDGFWEYVLEEEMEIDLSKSQTAKEWVNFMLVRLLLKFNGNNDNFTVIGGIIK